MNSDCFKHSPDQQHPLGELADFVQHLSDNIRENGDMTNYNDEKNQTTTICKSENGVCLKTVISTSEGTRLEGELEREDDNVQVRFLFGIRSPLWMFCIVIVAAEGEFIPDCVARMFDIVLCANLVCGSFFNGIMKT